MKIAIIAPPWTVLPSEDYTGIEPTVFNLSEEYVKKSQEVILFAPRGSVSSAETLYYPEIPPGIDTENEKARFYIKDTLAKYAYLKALAEGADIVHDFTLAGEYNIPVPVVHTVDSPPGDSTIKLCRTISAYPNNYMVTVSKRQRGKFSEISSGINFVDTIYKCINTERVKWSKDKEDYILYLGNREQKKDLELVKRVVAKSKKRLVDIVYGRKQKDFINIKPWLRKKTKSTDIQLTEDLPRKSRYELYRNAAATIHIGSWNEPFAMEVLESLACGTPVIALRRASAPEVIEDGRTGFLVETEKEMLQAIKKIKDIKPSECRKTVEKRFSSKIIAEKYLRLYRSLPKI